MSVGEVRVNDSLLTGESDENYESSGSGAYVRKFCGSGRVPSPVLIKSEWILTFQADIEAKAMKERRAVGNDTLLEQNGENVVRYRVDSDGITLYVQGFFFNDLSFRNSFVSMVAAVLGMIPEGIYIAGKLWRWLSVL